jgi:hypothetical protein
MDSTATAMATPVMIPNRTSNRLRSLNVYSPIKFGASKLRLLVLPAGFLYIAA